MRRRPRTTLGKFSPLTRASCRSKLRRMIRSFRPSPLVALLVLAAACDRNRAPAASDTLKAAQQTAADSARASSPARNWDMSAGPVLLIAGDSPLHAAVIVPDSATAAATLAGLPRPASVTLFGRNGTVQNAELPVVADSTGRVCCRQS